MNPKCLPFALGRTGVTQTRPYDNVLVDKCGSRTVLISVRPNVLGGKEADSTIRRRSRQIDPGRLPGIVSAPGKSRRVANDLADIIHSHRSAVANITSPGMGIISEPDLRGHP